MIYLSIVNHNHDHLIISNSTLSHIAKKYTIIIKSNTPASTKLKKFAHKNKITLLDEKYGLGFGENNNYIFNVLKKNKLINADDLFLVINPDVTIELAELTKLEDNAIKTPSEISTINLYQDSSFTKPELSIKKFPKLMGPIKGLISKDKRSDSYDKLRIDQPCNIDWAAGSFLLFQKNAYEKLEGFDNKFFMYFEDADICRRAMNKNMHLRYIPNIKAIHLGAFNNRNVLSKHFMWYLSSYYRYHSSTLIGLLKIKIKNRLINPQHL